MKKIFITGINGLLGTNLVNDLLSNGFFVKGLIRNKKKFEGNKTQNLELIQGNLFNNLSTTLKEIDVVIHIAAETKQSLRNYSDYWKINYNATVQLFNTAIQCKVKKFIFISTANTLGYGSINDLGNEHKNIRYPFDKSYYAKSKFEAENYLLHNNDKIDVVIINPTFMLGSFDTKPSSGKIILLGWKKKIIFYPPGGKNFVHVKDVSNAIINSIDNGKNGEKYIVANENLSYAQFYKKLNHITDQNPVMLKISEPVLITIGYFGEFLRFLNIKTSISLVNMKILCINNFYSGNKSVNELKIKYRTVDTAIKDAVNYFENKYYK
jgi:nucleoside-diphosphate-sugar epimerase